MISGTPTSAPVTYNFTVQAADANNCQGTKAYSVTVSCPAISVNPATLPAATQFSAYAAQTVTTTGGTAPFSYAISAGSLPVGMTLSSAGVLSGTPTGAPALKSANAVGEGFWKAGSMKQAANTLAEGSAFRYIAESGVKADEHHEGTLVEQIDRHTWISMSVDRAVGNIQSRMQDGLAVLATVGSTAPFVGLFGTVWGIYHALTAIGIAGQASIDKVAGPVGESLIMTAFGLAVAVPAVMGYNWLIRRNKTVMEKVRAFSGDVHNVLLSAKR